MLQDTNSRKPQNAARTHGSLTSEEALDLAVLCVGGESEGPGQGASIPPGPGESYPFWSPGYHPETLTDGGDA